MKLLVPALPARAVINRRAPRGGLVAPERFYRGGQFLPTVVWEQQKREAKASMPGILERFGDNMQFLRAVYEQNAALAAEGLTKVKLLPLTTVEARMKATVRSAYEEAFLAGKRSTGNLTAVTDAERKVVRALCRDEYKYLRGFLSDMRGGQGRMPYEQRMEYYQMAARELYNLGFVLGDLRPGRALRWIFGDTQHCRDCKRFADHGWYTISDFIREVLTPGYLPQSGKLACLGRHCKCSLEERLGNPV